MAKYRAYGIKEVRVYVEVEADSMEDAIERADNGEGKLYINYEEEPTFHDAEPI
jgi:hypothetical protein